NDPEHDYGPNADRTVPSVSRRLRNWNSPARFPNSVSQLLPIFDEAVVVLLAPLVRWAGQQLDGIRLAGTGVLSRAFQVPVHPRTDVEGGDLDGSGVGKAQPGQRVDHREGLRALRRNKVGAGLLVYEVKAGTDDRDPMHAARLQQPLVHHVLEVQFNRVVGIEVAVGRDAAVLERLIGVGLGLR